MSGQATRTIRRELIAALARRADAHHGETRHLLDVRLTALRDAQAADGLDGARHAPATAPSRGPLGDLVDRLAAHAAVRGNEAATPSTAMPVPAALDEVRRLWSGIRAESQLRQSLQPVAGSAGPLNSAGLVHRALTLMHDQSPGYLQHFLSYVDELAWLEQLPATASTMHDAPASPAVRKRSRRKPRA